MRKKAFIVITLSLLLLGACTRKPAQEGDFKVSDVHNPQTASGLSKKAAEKMPVITFETTQYDFGQVVQGERLSYAFKFKNTGKSNLIIYSSEATCGCTTSTPPKAPIRPGESGEITVTFDSKTQSGKVTKRILVAANTYPTENVLTITADVSAPNK
ncbi:MAG: DUF1573 domain-containing protein [Bacteroidales bacterium]|nr:DUF1573 domain-containing protein [Bacteroidales bacterium]MCR5550550.1 DUF1573 domain-containing protein [Bacteroidales bacterium]